jgi:hypothetical protein
MAAPVMAMPDHGLTATFRYFVGLHYRARASCFWVYAYPAFLRYAAHSAGGYWARILPQASEIAS